MKSIKIAIRLFFSIAHREKEVDIYDALKRAPDQFQNADEYLSQIGFNSQVWCYFENDTIELLLKNIDSLIDDINAPEHDHES